jgi:predicted transcriptional regulator
MAGRIKAKLQWQMRTGRSQTAIVLDILFVIKTGWL